ncbi:UbiA [Oceaniovalibus guishaninsula JLT2003]|uniref:4-hydroxybenzoate octaprenyltransferase n=1 Tax=Oceaniovalibus guishaninsula JLT2003 TaxID=1231392 RepID=K2I4C5_9RHOB|nr:4-hydroxybenzoate octaprenyltransferase [Oceaniovalibus guishaninsula]EKE43715.1 UbiA [Oceaniovalibus guishaninsula JLT2003]
MGATKGQVADAVKGNWVDRAAPAWARPWLRLSRADRPIGTWLLLLPCWWGLGLACAAGSPATWQTAWIGLGCALGAFLMRGAGCTWNDVTDRHIDAAVARTRSRPLPSGQVTVRGALVWMAAQALLAFAILLTFAPAAVALGIAALVPVAVYPFAKRFTWWPQVFLGLAFNWGALLAWAAQTGGLTWPPVVLYAAGIAWTLYYDTIYAYQDIEDDALIGVKSTARLFDRNGRRWLAIFAVATVALLALAILAAVPPGPALALAMCAPVAVAVHLGWQMRRLDLGDPARCLTLFRETRTTGLLVALFLALASLP